MTLIDNALTIPVYQPPLANADPSSDCVFVGIEDLVDASGWVNALDAQQEWAGMPAIHRYEDIILKNVLYSWTGELTADTPWASLATYWSQIESAVMADISIGGSVLWGGVQIDGIDHLNAETGVALKARFTLTAKARI